MTEHRRKVGLSDEVQVKDANGDDIFASVDANIASASHDVELPSNLFASVGSGAGMVARTDGVVQVEGDLTIRAIDLSVLQLVGSYSDDGSTWTVESSDVLPTWEFHQQVTKDETIVLGGYSTDANDEPVMEEGFKFGSYTLNVSTDEAVELDFSGVGTYAEVQTADISTNNSTLNPKNWLDAHVEIDGTSVGSLEDIEITVEREAEAVRGLEDRSDATRVLPDEVVEGMRDVSVSMTVEITDREPWEDVFGDTTTPLQPSTGRSEKTVDVVFSNGDTLTVQGAMFENVSGDLADDAEVRTVGLEGNAKDWKATGDV